MDMVLIPFAYGAHTVAQHKGVGYVLLLPVPFSWIPVHNKSKLSLFVDRNIISCHGITIIILYSLCMEKITSVLAFIMVLN